MMTFSVVHRGSSIIYSASFLVVKDMLCYCFEYDEHFLVLVKLWECYYHWLE